MNIHIIYELLELQAYYNIILYYNDSNIIFNVRILNILLLSTKL